jgi:hypothetical protein
MRISTREIGRVLKISKEPLLYSSAYCFIVMAGIVKEKTMGSSAKKERISALAMRKNGEKKNHPVIRRKIAITIYADGEKKKLRNSLFKI